jgi:hypothetical protein
MICRYRLVKAGNLRQSMLSAVSDSLRDRKGDALSVARACFLSAEAAWGKGSRIFLENNLKASLMLSIS